VLWLSGILVLASLITLLALLSAGRARASAKEIAARLNVLRAQGAPVCHEDLAKIFPDPGPAEDASLLLSKSLLSLTKPRPTARIPFATGARVPTGTKLMSSEMSADVAEYLEQNRDALQALPKSWPVELRFSMHWDKGFNTELPIVELRHLLLLLAIDACYQAEHHNRTGALRSIQNLLAISEALKKTGSFMYYIIGCVGQDLSISSLEHTINQGQLNPDDLKSIALIYSKVDPNSRLASAMAAERCHGIWSMESIREAWTKTSYLRKIPAAVYDTIKRVPPIYSDADYLDYLSITGQIVSKMRLPTNERLAAITADAAGLATASRRRCLAFQLVDPKSWQQYIKRDLEALANRNNALAAIAIETYRLKHGRLPSSISELAPEFLSATPLDPFTGNPLHYEGLPRVTCFTALVRMRRIMVVCPNQPKAHQARSTIFHFGWSARTRRSHGKLVKDAARPNRNQRTAAVSLRGTSRSAFELVTYRRIEKPLAPRCCCGWPRSCKTNLFADPLARPPSVSNHKSKLLAHHGYVTCRPASVNPIESSG